jgi:hypothetical protein
MPVIPRYTGDQEIESLPSKNEALSSNPVPPKKKKKVEWSIPSPKNRYHAKTHGSTAAS